MSNRRSGGRSARRAQRNAKSDEVTTFLQRRLEPVEVLDEAGLQQIEANAELILSEVGVAFQEFPEA